MAHCSKDGPQCHLSPLLVQAQAKVSNDKLAEGEREALTCAYSGRLPPTPPPPPPPPRGKRSHITDHVGVIPLSGTSKGLDLVLY